MGLGNPGSQYAATRHNLGFRVADRLLATDAICLDPELELYELSDPDSESSLLFVLKPQTYMNRSGAAVAETLERGYGSIKTLLVAVDDLDLDLGRLKIKGSGSSGGHRGLADIEDRLGTQQFARLRLGIGRNPRGVSVEDFVLAPFEPEELDRVERLVAAATEAVKFWQIQGLSSAMNRFNRKVSPVPPKGPTD